MKIRLVPMILAALVLPACAAPRVEPGEDLSAAIAAAHAGDRIVLASGRHAGPIVIDKPLTLIGREGAVVYGPDDVAVIVVTGTAEVTIRGLTVEGGYTGIDVRESDDVTLDRVSITGAVWHGIFVHDAEVVITDCSVSGMRGPSPQGIEIINSDAREESLVEGCHIRGPVVEGIVSHVSHVRFRNNTVTGSTVRGIAVTEMSAGTVEGNQVFDAIGTAYYCGDGAMCSIVGNSAERIGGDGTGITGNRGHAVLVQYHAMAFVEDTTFSGLSGEQLLVMLESLLVDYAPYPLTPGP
jgi:parallel beta-helix repeat protein